LQVTFWNGTTAITAHVNHFVMIMNLRQSFGLVKSRRQMTEENYSHNKKLDFILVYANKKLDIILAHANKNLT
jgi:hypothetical protein